MDSSYSGPYTQETAPKTTLHLNLQPALSINQPTAHNERLLGTCRKELPPT